MLKRYPAMVVLAVVAAPAFAQPYQSGHPGWGQAQVQDHLVNAYAQSLADYTACLQVTRTASRCGVTPESAQTFQPRHVLQQEVRVTDYYCVDRFIRGGQTWFNAMQACSRWQQQQSIGGFGQVVPDATERDILDAQTGALKAFTECVKSAAPGTKYCAPPP